MLVAVHDILGVLPSAHCKAMSIHSREPSELSVDAMDRKRSCPANESTDIYMLVPTQSSRFSTGAKVYACHTFVSVNLHQTYTAAIWNRERTHFKEEIPGLKWKYSSLFIKPSPELHRYAHCALGTPHPGRVHLGSTTKRKSGTHLFIKEERDISITSTL